MPAQLRIDIVSDVVCPWCAIGYAKLVHASAMLGEKAEIAVKWHPFELAHDTPPEGQLLSDYSRERYGATPEQSRSSRSRIVKAGAAAGLDFRYTPESRIYNSFDAHRLLAWAGETGGQTRLQIALFTAYFTDQANIADEAVLLDAVEAAGLDANEARAVLAEGRYRDHVRAEEGYWQDRNITGVPTFIVNDKYMIPGAQEAETLVRYLERVIEKEALAAA